MQRERLGAVTLGVTLPLLVLVLVLVLAAGCTSSPEPSPLPPPTSSSAPSPSASPSRTPPTLPPEAEGTSPKAAKAFARYYVDTINYAMATGDVAPIESASESGCEVCRSIRSDLEQAYSKKWRLVGDGWKVRSSQYIRLGTNRALVGLALNITAQAVYKTPGESPSRSAPTRGFLDVRMEHSSGEWRVFSLDAS